MKIVIITPVRNEASYIPVTMKCMIQQTLLPAEWIIVNDGSTDNTESVIRELMKGHTFIKYICLNNRGFRKPGQGVIETFYEGFKRIERNNYNIIAKFDGDLEFQPDMLEKISNVFKNDPELGITGGTRYERKSIDDKFRKVLVPKGFVGGPFKFYQKKCFKDIGGLIKRAGWDGVDTIKANMKGWKTGEIDSLKIIHLKPTGMAKGEGLAKACMKYGDVSYYMGGYLWYFLLRVIGRSIETCNLKVGYYMLKGYLSSKRNKLQRESYKFRTFLKRKQIDNLNYWLKCVLRVSNRNVITD